MKSRVNCNLAHSADLERNIPEQSFIDHISGVYLKAEQEIEKLKSFISEDHYNFLKCHLLTAILYHDTGKLDPYCQMVLSGKVLNCKMPNHVDAGVSYLISQCDKAAQNGNMSLSDQYRYAAWLVFAHHLGYQKNLYDDLRDNNLLGERCPWVKETDMLMSEYVDAKLDKLMELHKKEINLVEPLSVSPLKSGMNYNKNISAPLSRLALSVLVTADYYDTAKNYKNFIVEDTIPIKANERLLQLDKYVSSFSAETERNKIRQAIYQSCRHSEISASFTYLASEVGNGKTLSSLAYALHTVNTNNMSGIIYVAPYTNIISQTADTYRKAIVLPEEDDKLTVAEHHLGVDFEHDLSAKLYTQTWNCPITCTTAVQFCETLAGYTPKKLRKYLNLAGKFIIFDESHCCLPSKLWPLTLYYLKWLVENMGCRVLFVSGSMTKPWEIKRFRKYVLDGFDYNVPSIVPPEISEITLKQEKSRVTIKQLGGIQDNGHWNKLSLPQICNAVINERSKGPVVAVFNTVKNAALVAKTISKIIGREHVLHMSTALCATDREVILEDIKSRLSSDENFILIATSCIESGINISFRNGFRENCNLNSALQLAGRINRDNVFNDSTLYVFELDLDDFTENKEFRDGAKIFREYYALGKIGPEHCAEAMEDEIGNLNVVGNLNNKVVTIGSLMSFEQKKYMKDVGDIYQVIPNNKITVIVKPENIDNIEYPTSTDIVRNSVQIFEGNIKTILNYTKPYEKIPGMCVWSGKYDTEFLGYMEELI
jgi:CRISPR/Cas system-associated endonuclease/helicase Cas3